MHKIRIDAITGLRGFAALMVFYAHLAEKSWLKPDPHFPGEVGVMIFFSLSGFLIAYLYLNQQFSLVNLADYVVARFSRIAPAYLFIVLLSFIIYTYIDPNFVYAIDKSNIERHLLFSGNVSAFWSIPPEVQFYALFILVWAVSSRYLLRLDVTGIALLVLFFSILMSYRDVSPGTVVVAKLHYFLFGALAGLIRSKVDVFMQDKVSLVILQILLIALPVAVELNYVFFPFAAKSDFYQSIPSALMSSLLVLAFSLPSRLGRILFENKALMFCGECSFSIYLLNIPVIYLFHRFDIDASFPVSTSLLIVTVVIALAWLNYQFIERPGARMIRSFGNRLTRLMSFDRPAVEMKPVAVLKKS